MRESGATGPPTGCPGGRLGPERSDRITRGVPGYPFPADHPDCDHLLLQIGGGAIGCRVFAWRGGRESPPQVAEPLPGGSALADAAVGVLARLREDPSGPPALRLHRLRALLGLLLGEVAALATARTLVAPGSVRARRAVVERVRAHIRETLGRGVALDGLARMTGYSRHHLLRLFRERTGMTVHAYIDAIRLEAVRAQLGRGERKRAVAELLGFSGAAPFSRWLRRRCPELLRGA